MNDRLRRLPLLVAAACLATTAYAADAQPGTRVTDPDALASMGFSPDAIVYLAPGVVPGETTPVPPSYGIGSAIQLSHPGSDFRGRVSTYAYDTGVGARDVTFVSGDMFVDSSVTLPAGAIWESTRFWVNDTTAQDMTLFLLQSCLPASGAGPSVQSQLGTGTSTGTSGFQSIVVGVSPTTVIDNNACIYWARVRFGGVGLTVQKARTQYRLQVSPAPATATFPNDVPTTSGFFRFVEALAAAGITGGCGAGSFCPNDPVTRGQMAVFLSTALGLHFPN